MVVLGGDFQRLQMKPVEGALNSACWFVIDTQAFSADVVVVLKDFEQVVQAVVFQAMVRPAPRKFLSL